MISDFEVEFVPYNCKHVQFNDITNSLLSGNFDKAKFLMGKMAVNFKPMESEIKEVRQLLKVMRFSINFIIGYTETYTFLNQLNYFIIDNNVAEHSKTNFYLLYLYVLCEHGKFNLFENTVNDIFEYEEFHTEIYLYINYLKMFYFTKHMSYAKLLEPLNSIIKRLITHKYDNCYPFYWSDKYYIDYEFIKGIFDMNFVMDQLIINKKFNVISIILENMVSTDNLYDFMEPIYKKVLLIGNINVLRKCCKILSKKLMSDSKKILKYVLLKLISLKEYNHIAVIIDSFNIITYDNIKYFLPKSFISEYAKDIKNIFKFYCKTNVDEDRKNELYHYLGKDLYLERLVYHNNDYISLSDLEKYRDHEGHYSDLYKIPFNIKNNIVAELFILHLGFRFQPKHIKYDHIKSNNIRFITEDTIPDAIADNIPIIDICKRVSFCRCNKNIKLECDWLQYIIECAIIHYNDFHHPDIKSGILEGIAFIMENNYLYSYEKKYFELNDCSSDYHSQYDLLFSPLFKYCLNYGKFELEIFDSVTNDETKFMLFLKNFREIDELDSNIVRSFINSDELELSQKICLGLLIIPYNQIDAIKNVYQQIFKKKYKLEIVIKALFDANTYYKKFFDEEDSIIHDRIIKSFMHFINIKINLNTISIKNLIRLIENIDDNENNYKLKIKLLFLIDYIEIIID